MMTKWSRYIEGEETVLISLAVSVGLVTLAIVGWCVWTLLAPIAQTVFVVSSLKAP